ncbi:hypothetical protein HDV05_003596 [Chytridiales sp. JEL 0842]|nr:hypothetical protein HDV05_003596 [Chytridiales sp. JEL 0842]
MASVAASHFKSKVAIIGSGPAGFYTADHLLRTKNVLVDMYEKLPVPYGLIRFGIAPDHADAKNVIHKFEKLAEDPNFRFIGNVSLNKDIHLPELRQAYDSVIISTGATHEKFLGLPNERETKGVFSAQEFVHWFNGYPDYQFKNLDLEGTDTVAVVGQGNVALDLARMLVTPVDLLRKTDTPEHVLESLAKSRIKNVHLIGRRGPLQVACTAKELREMMHLPTVKFHMDSQTLKDAITESEAHLKAYPRPKKRLLDIFSYGLSNPPPTTEKIWSMQFKLTPTELLTANKQLVGLRLAKNILVGTPPAISAKKTEETVDIPCGILIRSIGYKAVPIDGLPFDETSGVVPNDDGRVLDGDASTTSIGNQMPGLYVAGWLKRGPVGVIAATMYDAFETADSLLADIQTAPQSSKPGFDHINDLLRARCVRSVDFKDWKKIDEEEVRRGDALGKPREKILGVPDKLKFVFKATYQHSRNLAFFVTIYKSLMLLQRVIKGKEDGADPFVAGLIGGYIIFGEDNNINQQIVLYLFSRISMGLAKLAVKKEIIPQPAHAFPVFAAVTWGIVMWLFRQERDVLQGSLQASMQYLYNDSEVFSNFRNWLWHNR